MAKRKAKAKRVRATTVSRRSRTKPGPGRPPVHNETWSKVSVVLFDRQIHHLDRVGSGIRSMSGKSLNRAEIIRDRKSTRLNSSHVSISYAVFCLKRKNDKYTLDV